MSLRSLVFSLLFTAHLLGAPAGVVELASAKIRLADTSGHFVKPLADHGQKATVLFFLMTDCPLCNAYAPEIARIAAEYREKGVESYAIYASESAAEITRHHRDYKLPLPALLDPGQQLAALTGATITPEVCVLGPDASVRYRGRIDDRAVKPGTVRAQPRQCDLRLALDAVLADKPVAEKFTKAIGCYLPTPAKP